MEEKARPPAAALPSSAPAGRMGTLEGSLQDAVRLDQVAGAHEHMRANRHFGKIVLLP